MPLWLLIDIAMLSLMVHKLATNLIMLAALQNTTTWPAHSE